LGDNTEGICKKITYSPITIWLLKKHIKGMVIGKEGTMKKIIIILPILLVLSVFFYSCSDKVYSTTADTVNLTKEYRVLLRDVVNLKANINKVKSNLPVLEAKAQKADANSKESLEESRRQASTATGGDLKQIRRAESKADDAQDDAEESKDAHKKLEDAQSSLDSMQKDLETKEARLAELDQQRQAIKKS
jgi:cell division protein FtsB